jgi:Fe-S cluster assembly protein SufD
VDGLYIVDAERHVDHQTSIDHATPHGTSHQLYKGILGDRATAAFSGRILVRPDAQKTDARQANHNLLLSPHAVADSKPQLEIFADDVKCAHGATVGQLDDEAIFYLRSRGLSPADARTLLVRAFAGEVPARLEHPVLRAYAEARVAARLPEDA